MACKNKRIGCIHKKENEYALWCLACAEKKAGPKPECVWQPGDYAATKYGQFDPDEVISSTMFVIGTNTKTPKWAEYIECREGSGGNVELFSRMKLVPA